MGELRPAGIALCVAAFAAVERVLPAEHSLASGKRRVEPALQPRHGLYHGVGAKQAAERNWHPAAGGRTICGAAQAAVAACALASSTSLSKAAASAMATSLSILRLRKAPAFLRPFTKWL